MSNTQHGLMRFAPVNITTATTTVLQAAVAGSSVVVTAIQLEILGASTTAVIRSSSGATISGTYDTTAGSIPLHINMAGARDNPLMSTVGGESLEIVTTGAAVNCKGFVTYYLSSTP